MRRWYRRLLLPGVIFQSVLIGGAYATGREIVQYGARFGERGLWAMVAIGVGFTVLSAVCYEYARITRQFDYRGLVRSLIGPLWPLFDLLYVAMVVVVIAVVSAATGSIGERVLGLPFAAGVGGVVIVVGMLNAAGREVIEGFKSFGTALLYAGYALFAGAVLAAPMGRSPVGALGAGESGLALALAAPEVPVTTLLGVGLLYVGYNLAGLPATLFCLDRQERRRDALVAGLVTGLMSTVPFGLTFAAILRFWPDGSVLGAEVPWLVMLERVGGGGLVAFYAVVVLWTLVETSVGMIHAVTDRLSAARREAGGAALSRRAAGAIAAGLLLVAALLSRYGIIALVARGYTAMAYGFLLLFALPLLTRGLWVIVRHSDTGSPGSGTD